MIAMNPDYINKSLKSLGWYMQKQIKAGLKAQAPGGATFVKFMDPRIRAQLEGKTSSNVLNDLYESGKGWKRKYAKNAAGKSVRYPPFGKLQKAIGYQYDGNAMRLEVGYLSPSALRLGKRLEEGYTKPVNEAVRKLFWSRGIPISPSKSSIRIPARPVMQPMRRVLMPQMMPYIEKKLVSYWFSKTSFSPSASRKYKVYR
jgi:hypothetical protein